MKINKQISLLVSGLTELLQHLVALVQDEVLHVLETQLLALDEGKQTAWKKKQFVFEYL